MTARLTIVSLWALLAAGSALAQSAPAVDPTPAQLVDELRRGGLVIYLRHTATDYTENDTRMKSYRDCGGQRNLIERGRQDARNIGIAIRALEVPIGRVLASPYCRTMETAELAFGRSEIMTDVRYAKPGEKGAERYAPLRELLVTAPGRDTNTVIVGHGTPFYALTQLRLAEGEIAVLKPLGKDFQVVGRIRPDDWSALRAAARR